jgi:hypothetical protein
VKQISLNELIRCLFLFAEIAVTEYRTQISGVEVIFDFEGLSIQHIYQMSPSFASNLLHWAQVCNMATMAYENNSSLFENKISIFQ